MIISSGFPRIFGWWDSARWPRAALTRSFATQAQASKAAMAEAEAASQGGVGGGDPDLFRILFRVKKKFG